MVKKFETQILFQILLWCVGWFIFLLLLNKTDELDSKFWHRALISLFGISIIVFVNLKWLLPKLYFKNQKILYMLSCLVIMAVLIWFMHSDLMWWNQQEGLVTDGMNKGKEVLNQYKDESNDGMNYRWFIRNLPTLFLPLLGSSLFSISRFAAIKENEAILLEKAKLETEVKFLKSQINPHFLFNALHNIYALSIVRSEMTSDQILKLSDILRYMLYDSNAERVLLKREIGYLNNYLQMAQLKDSRGLNIRFNIKKIDEDLKLAPLLFIPFVENAFKHSNIENLKAGYIHISLNTVGQILYFEVENNKPKIPYNKDKIGGIGLTNIQQRLKLLYPNNHELKINETENKFYIHLKINCS